ncbi:hypothetical protein JQN58_12680 [Aneurinibacillus sp. BA2021]|nr:hypothetical protein [Aneurinibacillus sp. BA2021]
MKRLFFLLFLFLLLLTGCVKGNINIMVHPDSSADISYVVEVEKSVADQAHDILEEARKDFRKQGFIVSTYSLKNAIGMKATKHVDSAQQLHAEPILRSTLFQGISYDQRKMDISVKKGWLYDTYTLKANVDLTKKEDTSKLVSKKDTISAWQTDNFKSKSPSLWELLDSGGEMKVSISLPTDAQSHNASRILPPDQSSKTYEWDVIPRQNNELFLQANVLNKTRVILITVPLLTGSTLALYFYYRRRKRQIA